MKKLFLLSFSLVFVVFILHAQFSSSSFATKVDFTSGAGGTNSVGRSSSADFNGDGKIDAICPNITNNTVSIFKNTSTGAGSISFATKIDITTYSGSPECLAVADFDNDGKIDFAVAHGASSSTVVEVFRNTSTLSTISFASGITFTVGTCPKGIVARDFDGDGKADIATSNYGSNTISILRNTTTGSTISFATKIDYSAGSSPILIISNDFDGDGKLDLAFSNYVTSGYITIFKNTSSSSLAFTYWGALTTGNLPNFLHSSDIDGDGKPEIYVVNYGSYSFQVFRNITSSGSMNFASGIYFTTGSSTTYPQGIIAIDLDGDSKRDIVTTNSGGSTISVFKNTSTSGTISSSSFSSAVNFSAASANLISLDTADYDNDGKADITVPNNTTSTFSIFRNQCSATSPTTAGSTINFSSVGNYNMTVNFSKGDGARRIVLCKAASSVNAAPVSGTAYTASSVFSNGSQLGTGNYVVYSDTGSSFTLTGLSQNTTYYFSVFEYNGTGGYANYLTTSFLTGSQATTNNPVFFSKSTGSLNALATWGVNTDGTGTNPSNFSGTNTMYVITNGNTTLGGDWTVTGTGSYIILGDGTNALNLVVPSANTVTCDTLYIRNNATLSVQGTMTANRIGSETGSTALYYGSSSTQTVAPGAYYNLTIINANKTCSGNIVVRNTLTMATGINIGTNVMVLGTGTTATGTLTRTAGAITGKFIRWFGANTNTGTTGLFPIGTSTNYRPITVEYTTAPTAGGTIQAEFISTNPGTTGLPLFESSVFIGTAGVDGFWRLINTNGITAGNYTATITGTGFNGVSDYTQLKMIYRTGSSWTNPGTSQTNTGNNAAPTLSRTGLSAGSADFGIGGDPSVNALPVKLIVLSVHEDNNLAYLKWQTASEENSARFDIERSSDALVYNPIGSLQAAGNSSDMRYYKFKDDLKPLFDQNINTIYYRLKQLDIDGSFYYSNIITLNLKPLQKGIITLYPMPIENEIIANTNAVGEQILELTILDMSGRLLAKSLSNKLDVSFLSQGIYLIKVTSNQQTFFQKIMK